MKQYEHGGNVWVKDNPNMWLDFSANINPYGPPNIIKEVLKHSVLQVNTYPEPYATMARVELAKHLNISYDQVIVTSGGISAMELVIRVIKPNHTLIIQPGFVEYERLSKLYSRSFENYIAFQGNQYEIDLTILERKLKKADMIFLCHPSNPLGQTFSKKTLSALITLCNQYQVTVVLDEAFINYCQQETFIGDIDKFKNIIIVGSLTKIFSIPGVRIGYIAANNELIKKLEKQYLPWSLNIFAQSVVKSLNTTEIKEFELQSVLKNNSAKITMAKQLKQLGFIVYNSLTNYLLLNTTRLKLTGTQINHRLAAYQIMVRDCSNFIGLNNNFMRVAIKTQQQNQYLINSLKEVIKCGIC